MPGKRHSTGLITAKLREARLHGQARASVDGRVAGRGFQFDVEDPGSDPLAQVAAGHRSLAGLRGLPIDPIAPPKQLRNQHQVIGHESPSPVGLRRSYRPGTTGADPDAYGNARNRQDEYADTSGDRPAAGADVGNDEAFGSVGSG